MEDKHLNKTGKCEDCRGCVTCGTTRCIYYSNGDFENCYHVICRYCTDYLQKPKMFLNNVG